MRRTADPQTVDLIESTRLLVEITQSLIVRSRRECEQLRATIHQSRRLVDEAKASPRR